MNRPAPLSRESVWTVWAEQEGAPEMVCATSWSAACGEWWKHPTDDRLRVHAAEQLFVTVDDLLGWQTPSLDRALLLRAHKHVTATRAATEGGAIYRTLTTGALRSVPVVSHQRDGITNVFPAPDTLPALLEQLRGTFDALPTHPFVRAAWLNQAIGAVHPFIDANGGTARFLASIQLTRAHLPPFVLTDVQRSTSYVEAIVEGDSGLTSLLGVVHDVVQHQLARVLASMAPPADWTPTARKLAETWAANANAMWMAAAAIDVVHAEITTTASFVRRGYHVPVSPHPRIDRWSSTHPVPLQFQLAVYPARAGDETWILASAMASVGENDELAPVAFAEPLAAVFVAAPTESPVVANARFERWLAKRIDQCVRGLAAWM